jgi:transcriptional regulator with PAS, ATPase and Fis domain
MAAIPADLLESELFGHEKGAFTGAIARKTGKFEEAAKGTLFLDEIAELDLNLQSKLLRVLQEKEFEAVGSNEMRHSDVRLIAATSTDLEAAVQRGEFRADLYYRLNVLPIQVPPLRERLEDLPALCEAVFGELQGQRELHPDALALLASHAWPGNVRELRSVLERATLLSDEPVLDESVLRAAIGTLHPLPAQPAPVPGEINVGDFYQAREAYERQLIEAALAAQAGNVGEAAQRLGLGRSTLYKKMASLGIPS